MTHEHLARLLLDAVRAQQFESTPDALCGGAPLRHFPSIDLAVAAFPHGAPPLWANVLFSREHPQGVIADIGSDASAVRNVRFDADIVDAASRSVAWLPEVCCEIRSARYWISPFSRNRPPGLTSRILPPIPSPALMAMAVFFCSTSSAGLPESTHTVFWGAGPF